MVDYNKNTGQITMTRGDSFRRQGVIRLSDGTLWEPQEGDVIQFGVKEEYEDKGCLIKKTYTTNPFVWNIDPDDTKELEFGKYYYDLQLVLANGYTETFAAEKVLKLAREVV